MSTPENQNEIQGIKTRFHITPRRFLLISLFTIVLVILGIRLFISFNLNTGDLVFNSIKTTARISHIPRICYLTEYVMVSWEVISGSYSRYYTCIRRVATETGDSSVCSILPDDEEWHSKSNCIVDVAVHVKNPELCETIKSEVPGRNDTWCQARYYNAIIGTGVYPSIY